MQKQKKLLVWYDWTSVLALLLLLFCLQTMIFCNLAGAESLFRASTSMTVNAGGSAPRSLFTRPRPQYVGDIITIKLNESTKQSTQFNTTVKSERTIADSGTGVLNNAVGVFLNKLPVGSKFLSSATNLLKLPSLDGVKDASTLNNQATMNRTNAVQENVTCQVVEVLPNGNLMVQGRKALQVAKERTDIVITGIINPFYIDSMNSVDSGQVANLQFMMGGTGIISRPQQDGILTKLQQFIR
jgi:flagellar L-ring protein FlgH